jgi:hypothetical protein
VQCWQWLTVDTAHGKMCDEKRLKLQEEIAKQGEVVRKLKTTRGSKDKVSIDDFGVRVLSDVIKKCHVYPIAFIHCNTVL